MDFYNMEQFEIMGDAIEEVADWEAYERDMGSNPFEICIPTDEEMVLMYGSAD